MSLRYSADSAEASVTQSGAEYEKDPSKEWPAASETLT